MSDATKRATRLRRRRILLVMTSKWLGLTVVVATI